MASPVETGLTVDDLARFDDDERHKYELIDGELFVSPRGVLRHQHVATRLAHRLLDWADAHARTRPRTRESNDCPHRSSTPAPPQHRQARWVVA